MSNEMHARRQEARIARERRLVREQRIAAGMDTEAMQVEGRSEWAPEQVSPVGQ